MVNKEFTKIDIKKACDILRMDDGVGANNYIEQLSWLLFLKIFEGIEEELEELTIAENKKYIQIIDSEYRWSNWAKKNWKDKDEIIYFINQKLFPYLKNLRGTQEKEKISEIFIEIINRIISPHTILDTIDVLDNVTMSHYQDTHLLSTVYEEILQEMGSGGGWSGEFYTPRPIIRLMIKILKPKLGEVIFDPFVGSGGFLVESFEYIKKQNPKIGVDEWEILQKKTFYGQEKKPLPFLIGNMNMILHQILVPNLIRTNTLMQDVNNIQESEKVNIIMTNPPFGGKENQSIQHNFPIQMKSTEGLALQYIIRKLNNGGRCGMVLPESDIMFAKGNYQRLRIELLEKCNIDTIISLPKGVFKQVGADVKTYLIFFSKTGETKKIWYFELTGNFTKKNIVRDKDLIKILEAYEKKELGKNSWIVDFEELKKNNFNLRAINKNKVENNKINVKTIFKQFDHRIENVNLLKVDLKKKLDYELKESEFEGRKISDLIIRNKTAILIEDEHLYNRVTIKMNSKGIIIRDKVIGEDIGTKKQFIIKSGQFLLSKIDARNGAFGIVPLECDGAIITGNFWAYDLNGNLVLPDFFKYLLQTSIFLDYFEKASQGLTNRRYLQENLFLTQNVKIPDIKAQSKIIEILDICSSVYNENVNLELDINTLKTSIINKFLN